MKQKLFLNVFVFILLITSVSGYKQNPINAPTHQYITKESLDVWNDLPPEFLKNSNHSISDSLDESFFGLTHLKYSSGKDLITGSGEEDIPEWEALTHFWDADVVIKYTPLISYYDNGILGFQSSYNKALKYWDTKVIPSYLEGNIEESYYWLGRISHLLQDATVSAHMHLDIHPPVIDWSAYEDFAGEHYTDYTAEGLNEYNYEFLIPNFNWGEVYPKSTPDNEYLDFFQLFWYTAQKTQYFASKDQNGNSYYRKDGDDTLYLLPDLWTEDDVTIISNADDVYDYFYSYQNDKMCFPHTGANCVINTGFADCWQCFNEDIAGALMPHAMRATAGLYKLFWDQVHSYSWTTFHQNNQRTGYTMLKGDLFKNTTVEDLTYEGKANDYWDNPAIGNIGFFFSRNEPYSSDSKDYSEIVVGTSSYDHEYGRVFALDREGTELWSTEYTTNYGDDLIVARTPVIANVNNDELNEIVFGGWSDGNVYVLNNQGGEIIRHHVSKDQGLSYAQNYSLYVFGATIEDIDNNGINDIIFVDWLSLIPYQAKLYAYHLEKDESGKDKFVETWSPATLGNSTHSMGSQNEVAIADLNGDSYPDIVVTGTFFVEAFSGKDGSHLWEVPLPCSYGSPVIDDLDLDNDYEVIVNVIPSTLGCGGNGLNATYILDGKTGDQLWSKTYDKIPFATPSVAHLDNDGVKEFVVALNDGEEGAIHGEIRCFDWVNNKEDCNYDDNGNLGPISGSTSIADIDTDGSKEILFTTEDGKFYALKSDGSFDWSEQLSNGILGSPAIGDFDGDRVAEMAVVHSPSVASSFSIKEVENKTFKLYRGTFLEEVPTNYPRPNMSMLSFGGASINVFGGFNKQPVLFVPVEEVIVIEGELVNITASAIDHNNDSVDIYYGYPLDENGQLQTVANNHSGQYEVLITASDGNLTDSKYVDLTVFRHDTTRLNNSTIIGGNVTSYITIPNSSRVWLSRLKLEGIPSSATETDYQETTPVVIQANELNASTSSANIIDNNWSSYYSAGSLTGAIVEIQDLTVPDNTTHIVVKLRAKVYNSGNGRFALYNYQEDTYDVITSTIPVTYKEYEDYYFDIYESEDSLWTNNGTHYSLKVNNITNYINNSDVRWYYRYINGDYALQKIYESEVKFISEVTYPKNITVDFGNDGINTYVDELHEDSIKLNHFNDSKENDTFFLSHNSTTKYLRIPKNAQITKAVLKVGNQTVNDINATMLEVSENLNQMINYFSLSNSNMQSNSLSNGTQSNQTYFFNDTSFNFDAQTDWSGSCYVEDNNYPVYKIETQLDLNDFYWDYDEGKNTIIDGTSLDIRAKCYFSYGLGWDLTLMKQDTDERDGSSNYDKIWSGTWTSSPVTQTTSKTIYQSSGNVWGLGYTYCYVEDGSAWSYTYSYNDCESDTASYSRQGFYVQECLYRGVNYATSQDEYHIGCSDEEICYDSGANDFANTCINPSCSPSCDEWETQNYSNHACYCTLASGRCDYAQYGWQNVASDEICGDDHYPTDDPTITCPDYKEAKIIDHIQTCEVAPGRCDIPEQDYNSTHYCDEYNFTIEMHTKVYVDNMFVANVPSLEIDEIYVGQYLDKYLEDCQEDEYGYCDIPINFNVVGNMTFVLSGVDVNYGNYYIDFTDELQDYVIDCNQSNCTYPITINSQYGKVNVSVETYYGPETKPTLIAQNFTINATESFTINATDAENDTLIITNDVFSSYQLGNSLQIETTCSDVGTHNFNVTASDGLMNDTKTIHVQVNEGPSAISITSFQLIENNNDTYVELMIKNTLCVTLNNVTWYVDFGDGNDLINQISFDLQPDEEITVLLKHNYTNNDYYNLYAEVSANNVSDEEYFGTDLSNLYITQLESLTDKTQIIYEAEIKNIGQSQENNIEFTFDTGNNIINSLESFNLSQDESIFVLIKNQYNDSDYYNTSFNIRNSNNNHTKYKEFFITKTKIENSTILSQKGSTAIYEFKIENKEDYTILTNWSFENVSSFNFNLTDDVFVIIKQNYTEFGNKSVTFENELNQAILELTVAPILLSNINQLSTNVTEFTIENIWNDYLNEVNWKTELTNNITSNIFNLTDNETIFVLVKNEINQSQTLNVYGQS